MQRLDDTIALLKKQVAEKEKLIEKAGVVGGQQ